MLKGKKFAVTASLMVTALVSSVEAALSESLYELANFGQTMGTFSNSLNQLLHARSPQEQMEMQQRLQYVEQQSTMMSYTLESFIAADEALAGSQGSFSNYFGMGGDDQSITQVYQAFKRYQAMFSPHLLRATGQFPMANYERLYIRWQQTPATNPRQKEYAKQQFMSVFRSYARQFVYQTQEQMKNKQHRFLTALRKAERTGPFDMSEKMNFDKAFWDYQSMFSNMVEPKQGQIFLPEFPYNNMLVNQQQPNFLYNQSMYSQSGLNQFGYGATGGMGYQQSMGMGMGMNTGMGSGMNMGGSAFLNGRYSNVNASVQANQVVPLGGSSQSQLQSPYGAFAPSTSETLDASVRQQMYLKQKEYEANSNQNNPEDVQRSYADYVKLRDQWFQSK